MLFNVMSFTSSISRYQSLIIASWTNHTLEGTKSIFLK